MSVYNSICCYKPGTVGYSIFPRRTFLGAQVSGMRVSFGLAVVASHPPSLIRKERRQISTTLVFILTTLSPIHAYIATVIIIPATSGSNTGVSHGVALNSFPSSPYSVVYLETKHSIPPYPPPLSDAQSA